MKLKRFLLRYYPPGILLEYVKTNGDRETKSIDLLNLSNEYFYIPKHSLTPVQNKCWAVGQWNRTRRAYHPWKQKAPTKEFNSKYQHTTQLSGLTKVFSF